MKKIIFTALISAMTVFADEQTPMNPNKEMAKTQSAMLEEVKTQTTLEITNTFSFQQMTSAINELAATEAERLKWQKCALVSTRYSSQSKISKKYCGFLDDEVNELAKNKSK